MKKNIIFFAYSAVDLMGLYEALIPKYNVIWVVYHKDVYEYLKKKNIAQVYLLNISFKILSSNNFFIKLLKFIISLFNLKKINKKFYKDLENIEKRYNPIIIFTDTGQPLSNYKTKSLKVNTKHSVAYKKYFLDDVNFKYDHVLLPGRYHEKRIKEFHKITNSDNRFKVVGNIKLTPYLKNKNFNKKSFLNSLNLNQEKINVLFAPSWNAHGRDFFGRYRILPKSYGDQSEALIKLAKEINSLNCNFIIKLHHLSHFYLKKKVFKNLNNEKSCFVFKSGAYHDVAASNNILNASDILITDTSGISTTGIFLKKKIIFLNPTDDKFNWLYSDIEKELRPGFVCDNFNDIIKALKVYIENKDPYIDKKEQFIERVFENPYKDANIKIAEIIPEILDF